MTCTHEDAPALLVRVAVGSKQTLTRVCERCALRHVVDNFALLPGGLHASFFADFISDDGKVTSLRGSWSHALLDEQELDSLRFLSQFSLPVPPYTNIEDVARSAAAFQEDERRKSEHDANNEAQRQIAEDYAKAPSKSKARKGKAVESE